MTKPLVTFADPEALLIDYLTAAFAARIETYKPATITPKFPTGTLVNATHLQVELETGGSQDYPITERAQIRLTAYSPAARRTVPADTVGGRSDAIALASLALGLACAHPGDEDLAGVFPLIGRSDVVEDPTTGNLMAWCLVRADLLATQLAS